MPYETKTFSQYWYPIQSIGPAVYADLRAAVSLTETPLGVRIGICAVEALPGTEIGLAAAGRVFYRQRADITPGVPFLVEIPLEDGADRTNLTLSVHPGGYGEPIECGLARKPAASIPAPANEPPRPVEVAASEELYLIGLHLEQYLHPTWPPEPYWEEALRRDPGDARVNTALGRLHLRRGEFRRAEECFRRAIARLTAWNRNPYDGEAFYQLGLALKYQDRSDEAYDALHKSVWNHAWQAAGYYALAEIDCQRMAWTAALDHLDRSFAAGTENLKARALKAAVLRKLGRNEEAGTLLRATLSMDTLDYWSRFESIQLKQTAGAAAEDERRELRSLMRDDAQNYLDVAFDYAEAGLWEEADAVIRYGLETGDERGAIHPMLFYARGYFAQRRGRGEEARDFYRRAAALPPDYCLPARLAEEIVLENALAAEPRDAMAHYYLGNLLYDKKRYQEAIGHWETSCALAPGFAVSWRNLGIAYHNTGRDGSQARACFLRACEASPRDARLLFELDLLLKEEGEPPDRRLARLAARSALVEEYDPLVQESAALYNRTGRPEKALQALMERKFHPWEGGQSPHYQYAEARLLLGREALGRGDAAQAREHFESALYPPENVRVGRIRPIPAAHLWYYAGLAREALGDAEGARDCFAQAAVAKPGYSAETYYQALALTRLGREEDGRRALQALLAYAAAQKEAEVKPGYFDAYGAEIGPFATDMKKHNRAACAYLSGLALLGLGWKAEAAEAWQEALALAPDHLEAAEELRRLV